MPRSKPSLWPSYILILSKDCTYDGDVYAIVPTKNASQKYLGQNLAFGLAFLILSKDFTYDGDVYAVFPTQNAFGKYLGSNFAFGLVNF